MKINEYIGNKIKEYRIKKNITQEELGEYLKTTSQTISRYESGKLGTNQDILYKLAEYFKVSINEFFPPIEGIGTNMINDNMGNNYINTTQLSIMTGISIKEIKSIILGDEKLPKPSTLMKIAKALEQDFFDYLIAFGYIEDPESIENELYDTGIRYLLPEKEKEVVCNFLSEYWNKNSNNKIFTPQKVYDTLFEDENQDNLDPKKILIKWNDVTKEIYFKLSAIRDTIAHGQENIINLKDVIDIIKLMETLPDDDKKSIINMLEYFYQKNISESND